MPGLRLSRFFETSLSDAMFRIAGSLFDGYPALVAVYRDDSSSVTHWTLVFGLETERPLNVGLPTVTGVWCQCPAFEQRGPGHADLDDCGDKGSLETSRTVNAYIPMDVWREVYLVGTHYCRKDRKDFVVVAPDSTATVAISGSAGTYSLGTLKDPSQTAKAMAKSLTEIASHGLAPMLGVRDIAHLTVVDDLKQVVDRLDKKNNLVEQYWLFALRDTSRGGFVGLIELGCGAIQLRGVHVFSSLQPDPIVKPPRAAWLIHQAMVGLRRVGIPSVQEIERNLQLQWTPCPASWSSALPFYVVKELPQAAGIAVRSDGFLITNDLFMGKSSEAGGF